MQPLYQISSIMYFSVDHYMENVASDLLRKKDRMMDKFRLLMLQESMVGLIHRFRQVLP